MPKIPTSRRPETGRTPKNEPAAPKKTAAAKANTASNTVNPEPKKKQGEVFEHTVKVELTRDAKLTPAAAGGKRVADAVMNCIESYDRKFLLDTDGLKTHVQQVATKFITEAENADKKGSVYSQLQSKFPGAHISLVGTAAVDPKEQVYFLVREKSGAVHRFESVGGKPLEAPAASGEIFMAAEIGRGKHMTVRVPEVRFLINPTIPPSYGVGRTIGVVMDTSINSQVKNAGDKLEPQFAGLVKEILAGDKKGEDGKPLGILLTPKRQEKGVIVKYNGDKTYDVQVTQPDGKKVIVKETEDQIRAQNDPTLYNLHGSTYADVTINVDSDPKLKEFLAQAKAVADKDIPKTGTPEEIAKGQRQALVDLTLLCNKAMSYPDESPTTTDENSKKYMQLENSHSNWNPMKLGDLLAIGHGVCRHQAILMQLACQTAGISSRTVSAVANDRQGQFRGYHAFLETTLDDGTQYLTDPTWFDAGPSNVKGMHFGPPGGTDTGTPLWDSLYLSAVRQVLPTRDDTSRVQDHATVKFNESNNPVVDSNGKVIPGQVPGGSTPSKPTTPSKPSKYTPYTPKH